MTQLHEFIASTSTSTTNMMLLIPHHYELIYHTIPCLPQTTTTTPNFCGSTTTTTTSSNSEPPVFQGTVHIHGKLRNSNSTTTSTAITIYLHAVDLQIQSATLQEDNQNHDDDRSTTTTTAADQIRYLTSSQLVGLTFSTLHTPTTSSKDNGSYYYDSCRLSISFTGILNDFMRGFYRSQYNNNRRRMDSITSKFYMATTQMEPTDARRAFPCIDEPQYKATFQLTLQNIPMHLQTLSNTPILLQQSKKGPALCKQVTFQKTPRMSTYLIAWIVGEFDSISTTTTTINTHKNTTHPPITTTVYTVPGKVHQGKFCLSTASRALSFYQQQLFPDVPYPLTKSDVVAIPDFGAGAMENWGLVTYREAKVLVVESTTQQEPNKNTVTTSATTLRGIARTVCHELAHMWFGNLATPQWWTQLWLKEGVARYMEFVGIEALFPEWGDVWTEFVQSVYGLAQKLDALTSSHPVEVPVQSSDEINEIFDAISYAKGASIIRMIASLMGRETFFKGMNIYLKRFAYSNAVTNDLWSTLEETSGIPVVEFMRPWTLEVGYPILIMDDEAGTVRIERFLSSGPRKDETIEANLADTVWPIPVTVQVEGLDDFQGPWILNGPNGDDTDVLLRKIKEWSENDKWFKLNVGQTGFYRVAYHKNQLQQLSKTALDPEGPLSVVDRLGVIADTFATGRAGYSSITDALELIQHFDQHSQAEYVIWQEISENLSAIAGNVIEKDDDFYAGFQSFLHKLYSGHLHRIGWDATPSDATFASSSRIGTLRATMIGMLRQAGDSSTLRNSFERFVRYHEDATAHPISGDLQYAIFRAALEYDEERTFAMLKERLAIPRNKNLSPEEEQSCLQVLGCVQSSERRAEVMHYIFKSGEVRLQNVLYPLSSLATTTKEGGKECWLYFQANYDELKSRMGPMWGGCAGLCCRGLRTLQEATEVEAFFDRHEAGSARRRVAQSLELVRTRAHQRERDRPLLAAFFAN